MTDAKPFSFSLRVFIGLASFGLTLYFMRQSSSMLNSLILGLIIVLSASPLLYWLMQKGVSGWLAFVITLAAILSVFVILVLLLVVSVERLADTVPIYIDQLEELRSSIEDLLASIGLASEADVDEVLNLIAPGDLVNIVFNFLNGIVGAFSDVFLVGLIVIFLMVDAFSMPAKVAAEIAKGNAYVARLATFSIDLRQYVFITTIVGLVTGVLDTVFFLIMGVDLAVLWGILAFLLSYIPTIGFWLAAIPPTLLALLESGPLAGLVVFLGIVLINGFAENVVKPKYMGSGLNLSPFIVVFSVVFWSAVLGPMGAILSIPMTLIFKELILEMDEQNRWMANLMSAGANSPPVLAGTAVNDPGEEDQAQETEEA